jgi:hypothetical protein
MNTITYALIGLSIAAGLLAMVAAVAISWSERRQRKRAQIEMRLLEIFLSDHRLVRVREERNVTPGQVSEIATLLETGTRNEELKKSYPDWFARLSFLGFAWVVAQEQTGPRSRQGRESGQTRYAMLRDLLLSTTDNLPLEQVLLDPIARSYLEEVFELLPAEPVGVTESSKPFQTT